MFLAMGCAIRPGDRHSAFARRSAVAGLVRLVLVLIGVGLAPLCDLAKAEGGDLPAVKPGQAAEISHGGRLYDNHWSATGRRPPSHRNPMYPASQAVAGLSTWRCVSCHGWDYMGSAGHLGRKAPAFASIRGAVARAPKDIANFLKTSSDHGPVLTGLSAGDLESLSLFVCCGQHDIRAFIDEQGRARGNPLLGQDIFDNTCARCHQADGKAPIYGEAGDVSSLGWIARERPAQALHKIRNGVPNADMLSLRFLELKQIGDLLAYLQTLE